MVGDRLGGDISRGGGILQGFDGVDDVAGVQVAHVGAADAEERLCVVDQPVQVH